MSVWWPIRETPPSSPDSVGSWAGQLASDLTLVCDVCGDLRNEGQGQITRYFDYSSERQTAEAGCPFCDCLCQTVRHYFGYDPSNDGENIHTRARTFKIKISSNGPLILSWGEYDIVIYTPHGNERVWQTIGHWRKVPSTPGSEQSFAIASKWVSQCSDKHEACKQPAAVRLPKRIVDLGTDNKELKLFQPSDIMKARYAALSHCWGQNQPLRTTKSTISVYTQSIDWNALPVVFQDAITVARRLDLRYIWIDSLCIVQDDPDDWAAESVKMGRIYSNAYIVIAASQSRDGADSFLAPRRPIRTPLELSLALPGASPRKILARPIIVTGLSNEYLDSRAWTYQEQRLATRLLRYTSGEMVFQCRTRWYRCECGSSHKAVTTRELYQMALFGRYCEPIDSSHPAHYIFRQWQGMVSTYSMRSLTRESDRLPAMSGIADLVQNATKSRYLAGLWVDNLMEDLCWSVEPKTAVCADEDLAVTGFLSRRASLEYRAPTFSWSSINMGVISYELNHRPALDPVAVVLDAKCDLKKEANPLGEVTSGFLTLEAYLVQAELSTPTRRLSEVVGSYELRREGMETYMRADFPIVDTIGLLEDGSQTDALGRATGQDEVHPIVGSVLCLALGYSDTDIVGLVLGRSGKVPGAYERLGKMVYGGADWFDRGEVRHSVITIV